MIHYFCKSYLQSIFRTFSNLRSVFLLFIICWIETCRQNEILNFHLLELLKETVNRAWDKRIQRCKETTRRIWKQLSQFIFKETLFLKKKKSKGTKRPKRPKSFLTNLPPVYTLTQHSPNLCHALFFWITTIPITPSFFLVTHYSIFFMYILFFLW